MINFKFYYSWITEFLYILIRYSNSIVLYYKKGIILFIFITTSFLSILHYLEDSKDQLYYLLSKKKDWVTSISPKHTKNLLQIIPYRIQKGDNLWNISKSHGLSPDTLISFNFSSDVKPKNFYNMPIGKVIYFPTIDGLYEKKDHKSLEDFSSIYQINENTLLAFNHSLEYQPSFDLDGETTGDYVFIPWQSFSFQRFAQLVGHTFFSPLKLYRISSYFGVRIHPISKKRQLHKGMDLAAPQGTPIYSALGGRVINAGFSSGYGNFVTISHKNNYTTLYGHLNTIRVKTGTFVKTQQLIGTVGSTGASTGNHLHFEIRRNNEYLDPRLLTQFKKKKSLN